MTPVRADSEAPRRLVGAVKRAVGAVEIASSGAAETMRRHQEEARRELAARESALRRERQKFDAARAALRACLADREANCAGQAQAVRSAEAEVREAEAQVRVAREVLGALTTAGDHLAALRRRLTAGLAQHSEESLRELFAAATELDAYLAGQAEAFVPTGLAGTSSASLAPGVSQLAGGVGLNIGPKVARQMKGRDWTESAISEAIQHGRQVPTRNFKTGTAAIRYVHPTTGRSVVVDVDSDEVIQVGDYGFQFGLETGTKDE